jgi:hypothetical protein
MICSGKLPLLSFLPSLPPLPPLSPLSLAPLPSLLSPLSLLSILISSTSFSPYLPLSLYLSPSLPPPLPFLTFPRTDPGTLDLLQAVLSHPNTQNLMFIGAYRSNEVSEYLTQFVEYLTSKGDVCLWGDGRREEEKNWEWSHGKEIEEQGRVEGGGWGGWR